MLTVFFLLFARVQDAAGGLRALPEDVGRPQRRRGLQGSLARLLYWKRIINQSIIVPGCL